MPIFCEDMTMSIYDQLCHDGSTDNKIILQNIELPALKHAEVNEDKKNRCKTAAVTSGFLFCGTNVRYGRIAYLDVGISTSLESRYKGENRNAWHPITEIP